LANEPLSAQFFPQAQASSYSTGLAALWLSGGFVCRHEPLSNKNNLYSFINHRAGSLLIIKHAGQS